jgi:hypothetical protein
MSLPLKLAITLGATFLALTMVVLAQADASLRLLRELAFGALLASLVFACVCYALVWWNLTRRIVAVKRALDAHAVAGLDAPLRLAASSTGGDEIDGLLWRVDQLAARAHKQVEQTVKRRHELLVNVSHDLRTPLASMQGYLELLLINRGVLDPAEERLYLETAVRQAERLGSLVGDLFELTRLEAGEVTLELEAFGLAELVQDVLQRFDGAARERAVDLRLADDLDEQDWRIRVRADIGKIEGVLTRLIDNALRQTPRQGKVVVSFRGQPLSNRVIVSVRDSGGGIDEHDMAHLFDRYESGDRSSPGMTYGLGLPIARGIVRLHGSQLRVRSTLAQGSVFEFELDRERGPGPAEVRAGSVLSTVQPGNSFATRQVDRSAGTLLHRVRRARVGR